MVVNSKKRFLQKNLCMKIHISSPFLVLGLTAILASIFAERAPAQTFTNLHNFGTSDNDGQNPYAGLVLSGNNLYGTTQNGGDGTSHGTVFRVHTDGTGFTNLYCLASAYTGNSSDGAQPDANLLLSGNTLYGTAYTGGANGNGTVFKVNTDGTGFTTLHSFSPYGGPGTNSDGANSYGGLVLSGNMLYGTASEGGANGYGTLFALKTDGTGFTNLHNFSPPPFNINADGFSPVAGLILSGTTLYGTAAGGGASGAGTVFKIKTDGTGFMTLHSFVAATDGVNPHAGLTLGGNTLYGTTSGGGSGGGGAVFAINTNGTGFTTLHVFTTVDGGGFKPEGGLILSGNTLYGATSEGGTNGIGAVFEVDTDGRSFGVLHSFAQWSYGRSGNPVNSDGFGPRDGLVFGSNALYGTTLQGGSLGYGTIFSVSLAAVSIPPPPPQLTITAFGSNVILTWPTNAAGFTLQSNTNLASSNWSIVSPSAVVVNAQNTVTNSIIVTRKFYRLSQ
jgi:uncharacterized repeat protein (TIGR03803 family)